MTGIKELFRRKSKKSLRSESESGATSNDPPSPARVPPSSSWNNSQRPKSMVGSASGTHPGLASTTTAPQDPSELVEAGGYPYENLPQGRAPDTGAYPIRGNASDVLSNGQSASRTDRERSNSLRRPANIQVSDRTMVAPPGTALTSHETHAAGRNTYQDLPPIPKNTIRVVPAAGTNDSTSTAHQRITSTSSMASVQRTPIADQFAPEAWQKQQSSPPVPSSKREFINNSIPAAGQASESGANNYRSLDDSTSAMATTTATTQSSANELGQAATSGHGHRFSNGTNELSANPRHSSIPRRSLDKPLPVPGELQQQSLPLRKNKATLAQPSGPSRSVNSSAPPRPQVQPTQSDLQLLRSLEGQTSVKPGRYSAGGDQIQPFVQAEVRSGPQKAYSGSYLVEGAASPSSLEGIVNLKTTTDTSTHVRYAPPILHETVRPQVHHIREEVITREIHNHHIFHRILPIIDVQVLPAKHFVKSHDGPDAVWNEVPESSIPGRTHRNWVIAETSTKIVPSQEATTAATANGPRRFTARTFGPTEGDYKEYISEAGVPTKETTWIHPPRIAQAPIYAGITLPLDMD